MGDEKIYGVIVEWKDEGALIMEANPMTYEDAYNRMKLAMQDSRVIRVGMLKAVLVLGNESLLPKEAV